MMDRDKERFYEGIAGDFERIMNRYDLERRLEVMLASLPRDLRGATALDGGCGPGFFSRALADRGATVISADISPSLAAIASRRAGSRGVSCDVARLPFRDGCFDVVLSSECIEHTVDPAASFRALARVVAAGGHLVLSVPNARWRSILTIAEALRLRPYGGLENWVRPADLARWVREAGLELVRHFGVHPLPFQLPLARAWMPALERLASPLGMWMINQVVVAKRRGAS